MIDRQLAWSNPDIAAQLDRFIPCADEVWQLQHLETPEAKMFQSFMDDGHYAPRKGNGQTRQGIYAVAPSGKLLASWNARREDFVAARLVEALEAWDRLPRKERLPEEALAKGGRPEDAYPEDGLALRVFTRDLPREDAPDDWRAKAWNIDHLWLSREEAEALAKGALPERAARRIARLHGRDNARGQSHPFPKESVKKASLTAKVLRRSGKTVHLALSGELHVAQKGTWAINDRFDAPAEHMRSFNGSLFGHATWDGQRFTAFQLACAGVRTGATQYNERADDPGPAGLGMVFELAPEDDRVAPSWFWDYGWPVPPTSMSGSSSK